MWETCWGRGGGTGACACPQMHCQSFLATRGSRALPSSCLTVVLLLPTQRRHGNQPSPGNQTSLHGFQCFQWPDGNQTPGFFCAGEFSTRVRCLRCRCGATLCLKPPPCRDTGAQCVFTLCRGDGTRDHLSLLRYRKDFNRIEWTFIDIVTCTTTKKKIL